MDVLKALTVLNVVLNVACNMNGNEAYVLSKSGSEINDSMRSARYQNDSEEKDTMVYKGTLKYDCLSRKNY